VSNTRPDEDSILCGSDWSGIFVEGIREPMARS
jgi:hypothetical protein